MDSAYDFDRDDYEDEDSGDLLPPVIGGAERRLHVRAYEHWVSLLDGRPFPSIRDLDSAEIAAFASNSVLLDFSRSTDDPTVAYLGRALREECEMLHGIRTVADVPPRSLLSRLTDHYLQIIANKAPIGFEAEFTNHRGLPTLYRGILMPFSSSGETIDFVYGVIGWKHAASPALASELERQVSAAMANAAPAPAKTPWPQAEAPAATTGDTKLHETLAAARSSAEEARRCDGRAHAALYSAIGRAYDFALTAETQADAYAGLLQAEGLVAQARAPMTPIVKLVFGADYDKTRVTEYAAALSFARRQAVEAGAMAAFLEGFEGGLKGVVQAERAFRASVPRRDRTEAARTRLRKADPQAIVEIEAGEDEFVLLVARRVEPGRVAILAPLSDQALIDKAIRKAAS